MWRGLPPVSALCPALFQWLKQIEGTEAALTQKMLDLEKEKVKTWTPGWEEAERAQLIHSQEGFACIFILFVCTCFYCFCSSAVLGNYHPFTSLFT